MNWSKFSRAVEGRLIKGDKTVPPTTKWNYYWLRWFVWKRVVVFEVDREAAGRGFRVGFKKPDGEAEVCLATCYSHRYKMRLGHEDCIFFAVNEQGREIPLKVVEIAHKDSDSHFGVELF